MELSGFRTPLLPAVRALREPAIEVAVSAPSRFTQGMSEDPAVDESPRPEAGDPG